MGRAWRRGVQAASLPGVPTLAMPGELALRGLRRLGTGVGPAAAHGIIYSWTRSWMAFDRTAGPPSDASLGYPSLRWQLIDGDR